MQLSSKMLAGIAVCVVALLGASPQKKATSLGNFSVSLNVKNLEASKAFYEKLGFVQTLGNASQGWVIMQSGSTNIGLFHGMFERNTLTFNPGWNQAGKPGGGGEDVRDIQKRLSEAGLVTGARIESARGPAGFTVSDPDGNPILFDQHI